MNQTDRGEKMRRSDEPLVGEQFPRSRYPENTPVSGPEIASSDVAGTSVK